MIVVAGAGPLIHLDAIGHFRLLERLFGSVLVPRAVFHEVVETGAGLPGADATRTAAWIDVVAVARQDLVDALRSTGLHAGESEAIALAVERGVDRLLIDERQGRLAAQGMGIEVVGTVGVLVAARSRGEVAAVAPLLVQLQGAGLWLSDEVVRRVLDAVGE